MIEQEMRKAVFLLHKRGICIRQISRQLQISRNTVRAIIQQGGIMPESIKWNKIQIDEELLRELYTKCSGWIQRMHEMLEQEGISVGYSTLTRMVRELGLSNPKRRFNHVPDEPGEEMQHDTSIYRVKIGDKKIRVVGSILYLRYCKRRYLKFYRSFNRFTMKCFLYEALTFFGYTARICIIDNTNLARLRGTGKNAVIVPEMEQFSRQFGFHFICHEIGHSNRKAGNERCFYTVETNFFPGRTFESLEDLNTQAFSWVTQRMDNRPVGKSGLIPAKAFEHEKMYLIKIPSFVPKPYLDHKRLTDQYGYIAFEGNFYWVPGTKRTEVIVLQESGSIKIFCARELLCRYNLPPFGIKNKRFYPEGMPRPRYKPNNRKIPAVQEEKKLRGLSEEVNAFLDFALRGKQRHRFIRQLYSLYRKIAPFIFISAIKRALKYRITDINTIERIAILQISDSSFEIPMVETDKEFQKRHAYKEGCLSDEVDLSIYDEMLEDDDG